MKEENKEFNRILTELINNEDTDPWLDFKEEYSISSMEDFDEMTIDPTELKDVYRIKGSVLQELKEIVWMYRDLQD